MSEYFMGQIMMTGFPFAPKYFAQCNGQLMALQQNQALYSLLGTYYGGDGRTTFALPDLRSRTPAGGLQSVDAAWQPPLYAPGQVGGTEAVTLLAGQLPLHTHGVSVTSNTAGTVKLPRGGAGQTLGTSNVATALFYGPVVSPVAIAGGALVPAGGNQSHPNIQPYETINFNIALTGIFPSRG